LDGSEVESEVNNYKIKFKKVLKYFKSKDNSEEMIQQIESYLEQLNSFDKYVPYAS